MNAHCPSCLSEDIDQIVYGLPLRPPSPDGRIRLGGCTVMAGQPDFHCNACGNEWADDDSPDGRQRPTAEGGPDPYEALTSVEAFIGGGPGPIYEVTIDVVTGRVSWTCQGSGCTEPTPVTKQLGTAERRAFVEKLRTIDPLRWKARYDNPGVLDGTIWAVTITTGLLSSQHSGRNAYPRTWQRFRQLIERTAGHTFS